MFDLNDLDKLIVHQEQPLNAEPPLTELIEHSITPQELVYARNHCKSLLPWVHCISPSKAW
jgi:hypothetical protein